MKRVSASDAKNRFGSLLEEAALSGRVDIVKHGRVVGVLLSPRAFEELRRNSALPARKDWGSTHMIEPEKARVAKMIRPPGDFDE